MIWRDTAFKTHYRSTAAQGDNFTTGSSSTTGIAFYYPTIELNGARFWTVAGGATAVDTAVPVPLFQDDIILRGGMINLSIGSNPANNNDLKVKVYLIISDETPGIGALTPPNGTGGVSGNFPREWDPSLVPDSHNQFAKKILMTKTALIKVGDSLQVSYRLRTQKIDQEDYLNDNNKMWWVVHAVCNSTSGEAFRVTSSFNLSFCGDAV